MPQSTTTLASQPEIEVVTDFNLSRRGKIALRFALWIAKRIGVLPTVRIESGEDLMSVAAALRETLGLTAEATLEIRLARRDELDDDFSAGKTVIFVTREENISQARKLAPTGAHLLFPNEETGERFAADAPICFPFGSRGSSLRAARALFPLMSRLGPDLRVIACHTTYRATGVDGEIAVEHLSGRARRVFAEITRLADEHQVRLETDLGIQEPTIHGFVTRVANRHGCFLTVVSTGSPLLNGNGHLIVETGNGPVLVVAKDAAPTAIPVDGAFPAIAANDDSHARPTPTPRPAVAAAPRRGRFEHLLFSPYFAQGVSIVQYALKVAAKLTAGALVGSPLLTGDGLHNAGDIVQALLIMASVWITKRERAGYPFKLRELETLTTLILGGLVVWTGLHILGESCLGLLAQVPAFDHAVRGLVALPTFHPVHVEPRLFKWLAGLMSVSILLSLATSWLQITVGRNANEAAVVADGEETRADAKVEAATLFGVVMVHGFNARWAEYPFAAVVAWFVIHTGVEIFVPAWRSLLKKSLGDEVEAEIKARVLALPGVGSVPEILTYPIGRSLGIASVTVETLLGAERHDALRAEINRIVRETVGGLEGIRDTRAEIKLVPPSGEVRRIAYACQCAPGNQWFVVTDAAAATHVIIVDLACGGPERSRTAPYAIEGGLASFLGEKQVTELYLYENGHEGPGATAPLPCPVRPAHSRWVETCLGVTFTD